MGGFGRSPKIMRPLSKAVRRVTFAILLIGVFAVFIGFSLFRPLLRSNDYTVTATVDGIGVDATLLQAFPSGPYYIHLDGNSANRLNWFGVAFGRTSVFAPISIRSSSLGFNYIHADQDKGIVLTDGKLEDDWSVDFFASGVTFWNSSTRVLLAK